MAKINFALTDLTKKECCNTCTLGRRLYNFDGDYPIGIKCLENQRNGHKFDYLCSEYNKDEEFIKQNQDVREYVKQNS